MKRPFQIHRLYRLDTYPRKAESRFRQILVTERQELFPHSDESDLLSYKVLARTKDQILVRIDLIVSKGASESGATETVDQIKDFLLADKAAINSASPLSWTRFKSGADRYRIVATDSSQNLLFAADSDKEHLKLQEARFKEYVWGKVKSFYPLASNEAPAKVSFEEKPWPEDDSGARTMAKANSLRKRIPTWVGLVKSAALSLLLGSIAFQAFLFFQNRSLSESMASESLRSQKKPSVYGREERLTGKDLAEIIHEKEHADLRIKIIRDLVLSLSPEIALTQVRLSANEIGLKLSSGKKDELLSFREKVERRGLSGLHFGSMETIGGPQVTFEIRVDTPKGGTL